MVAVMVPAVDQVSALYKAARVQLADDLPASRVLRLPPVTEAGLDAAGTVFRVRHELNVAAGLIVRRAMGFPASARRRRVLAGLAKWVIGAPEYMQAQERWFCTRVVRDAADASAGTTTPPEVAGLIALSILTLD